MPREIFLSIPWGTYIHQRRYRLYRLIGSGSFGIIYDAQDTATGEKFAVKLEAHGAKPKLLVREAEIYTKLHTGENYSGYIPRILAHGKEKDFCYLAMDKLGKDLEDLFTQCGRLFSVKTAAMLAIQMIQCVEFVHNKGIVHRDIKPENFLMGLPGTPAETKLFLIDFGVSQTYLQKDGAHVPFIDGKQLTGTARYASIYTHMGINQTRRNDLESLGFIFVYFARGYLPWERIDPSRKENGHEKIAAMKDINGIKSLCQGLPEEFATYLTTVRNLEYDELPNYCYLWNLFYQVLRRLELSFDYQYDWMVKKEEKKAQPSNIRPRGWLGGRHPGGPGCVFDNENWE